MAWIDAIVVELGTPVPVTAIPTFNSAVLATVTVASAFAVVQLNNIVTPV